LIFYFSVNPSFVFTSKGQQRRRKISKQKRSLKGSLSLPVCRYQRTGVLLKSKIDLVIRDADSRLRRCEAAKASPARTSGDSSAVVPPVPIPNTAVKRCSPDGSATQGRARVGRRQNKVPGELPHRALRLCGVAFSTREHEMPEGSRETVKPARLVGE